MKEKILELIDSEICSLQSVNISQHVTVLNLHHNNIMEIDGLGRAINLQHLDLSSNKITKISGLIGLIRLRTLNLSSNFIEVVECLSNLYALVRIDLSFNKITNLSGFKDMFGPKYSLTVLRLHGNKIQAHYHVVDCMSGLINLRQLTLFDESMIDDNPICQPKNYRSNLLTALPQIEILDNRDRQCFTIQHDVIADIPEMSEFLDLFSTHSTIDTKEMEQLIPTREVCNQDKLLNKPITYLGGSNVEMSIVQCLPVNQSKQLNRPLTDEECITVFVECKSVGIQTESVNGDHVSRSNPAKSQNKLKCLNTGSHHRIKPNLSTATALSNSNNHGNESHTEKVPPSTLQSTSINGHSDNHFDGGQESEFAEDLPVCKHPTVKVKKPNPSTKSLRKIIKRSHCTAENMKSNDLRIQSLGVSADNHQKNQCNTTSIEEASLVQAFKELDRERAHRKTAELKCQELAQEITKLNTSINDEMKALEVTEQLKRAFTAEHRNRLLITMQLKELKVKFAEVCQTVETVRANEESQKQRFAEEMAQLNNTYLELQTKYNTTVIQAKETQHELVELKYLLTHCEQTHKDEMARKLSVDNPEFKKLVDDQLENLSVPLNQKIQHLREKVDDGIERYSALENEFRLALEIESERYHALSNEYEVYKQQSTEQQIKLSELTNHEEQRQQMVNELNMVIKEMKMKLVSQQKANLLIQNNQKERIAGLEANLEEARTRLMKQDNFQKELKNLKSELIAKESLIAGLRAERMNWSEELAKQGSTLAQDRGRLEIKIETQELEISTMRKKLEVEMDNVKIKSKIIDDQIDTIKKLKKALQDNQSEVKEMQQDALKIQHDMNKQLSDKVEEINQLTDHLKHLNCRKEELKLTVTDLQHKLGELQAQNESINERWRDRATLLDKFETQVEQMRQNWEDDQKRLTAERDTAIMEVSTLQVQMKRLDNEFRKQLLLVEEVKENAIKSAREEVDLMQMTCESRIAGIEDEMRCILTENEETKLVMQNKLNSISAVLGGPIQMKSLTTRPMPADCQFTMSQVRLHEVEF